MDPKTSRKSFRFRFPWRKTPAPIPTRPPAESQLPTQQATAIPPIAPSPEPQARPWTQSQPSSPSTTVPSHIPSESPSPPSLTAPPPSHKVPPSPQSQKRFQLPLPSHTPQPQPAAQTASSPLLPPSKAVPAPSHTASQPLAPSHTASQQTLRPTPPSQFPSLSPSPSPSPSLSLSPSPSPSPSPPPPPQSQKRFRLPSPSHKPQPQPAAQTASSPPLRPTKAVPSPSHTASQPPSSSHTASRQTLTTTPPSSSPSSSLSRTAPEEQPKREEKPKSPADETMKLISKASGLSTKTKRHPTPRDGQKQLEKQIALDGKETTETDFKERESSVAATYPQERSMGNESCPKSATFLGEQSILQREIKEDISKFVHKLAMVDPKQDIVENQASVITLAGENRGAAMHVGNELAKREGSVHIHRGYKLNQNDNTETTTDEEGSSQRRMEDQKTGEDTATPACINSNVQSFNNSIILNSSFGERNPGVHFLSHKPKESINTKEKRSKKASSKPEFNENPAQKLPNEPTVRRRCLRSLFLESSDTDKDNPKKPRRHGCRYSCEKKKDKDKQTEATLTK
ncbi:hypothetical protein NE237_018689 [Protea cynaroides]|uniref:Uncharacterized protein n=1 Tax=Protea cynaroides TaxID=273540 RepID=A0A9Q0QP88_9MAGN|nr:hypothetical protein NE237_018689 [Protea cynaroides]